MNNIIRVGRQVAPYRVQICSLVEVPSQPLKGLTIELLTVIVRHHGKMIDSQRR